ncbi:ABC transporter ATP-binding protein [uncultured Brevundimonas sp.]|uniref:ABC transporter ATP-binding protein n=1 Tax=uncultured Brevundimonas sp. TaxID=213418 RepID=UPI0030EF38D9
MAAVSAVALQSATAAFGRRPVLASVDLTVSPGELVALCGPNGAGKSSAIRAALGLLPLTGGRALLDGCALSDLSPGQRAACAAYLPQERRIAWNLPAVEVAALGAPWLAGEAALDRARAALVEVDIGHLADRGVSEMSGGERARVLLARLLTTRARALLADEPVAGLDPDAQLMVLERLARRAQAGQAVLVSLHDLTLAARFADRVVVLDQGRVVADGSPLEALRPAILRTVFGLSAVWLDGPDGPLLAASRAATGPASLQGR